MVGARKVEANLKFARGEDEEGERERDRSNAMRTKLCFHGCTAVGPAATSFIRAPDHPGRRPSPVTTCYWVLCGSLIKKTRLYPYWRETSSNIGRIASHRVTYPYDLRSIMAEALRELLAPEQTNDPAALEYLTYLAEQQSSFLQTSEPQVLSQTSHSLLLAIQALSKRSHKPIVDSAASHASLRDSLPTLAQRASDLVQAVPRLDAQAEHFSSAFGKASDSKLLARRKQALLLLRNSERLVDVMEMPLLLSSAVSTAPVNHSTTLELYAHVRRLASLYPDSPLVTSVMEEVDAAIRQMAADLIGTLRTPNLKLAAAVRTMGWLKRIVPDLATDASTEDALPALFLVCRLSTLLATLEALEPLRDLADEERRRKDKATTTWSGGQQTERYLKRFIEIFREQSFSIVSVFKSINSSFSSQTASSEDPLGALPSPMANFPLHMVEMLVETLRTYLPTVKDQTSRESILTQVLYCAGSLGRLGADFGLLLASIGGVEWVELVKRHRLLAGRLESVIGDYHRGSQAGTGIATSGVGAGAGVN
ncbi:unnamed protein product [Fusarium langsethiae]|nr:unnamed protein product [Fusarium langsethiae]